MGAVDALTGTYRLGCPAAGSTTRVRLSSFRQIDRLPGPAHPAVYRVVFACACGGEHVGLVGHDALDWAPLGLDDRLTYINLMTSRRDELGLRAHVPRVCADRKRGVAMVLLLPAGGRAATRHALRLPVAGAVPRDRRRGRPLPRL